MSVNRRLANELYVDTVGMLNRSEESIVTTPAAGAGGFGSSPCASSWSMRSRMRSDSSPAALRVKVRPRIWSGRACPLASSQSTRLAMVSVLPLPAPATTRVGANGASITACCSSVGGNMPSVAAIWRAEMGGGVTDWFMS